MKKKPKKKSPKEDLKGPEKGAPTERLTEGDEKPFDFGGLPDRDLKKNLGCG